MVIVYILLFILILGLVICIHEFGHYFFAKKAGILVNEFAFGMGPRLLSKKKGETVWSIRAFPIGGFCAMSGEERGDAFIKEGDVIRVKINSDNKITKIVLDPKNSKYDNLLEIKVDKFDLFGEKMSPLYINEYEVLRDAMVVFAKNEEIQIAPEERNFFSKSILQRFLVCFGGPLNNILLALLLFLILGFIVGVSNTKSNIIGEVSDDSPAAIAGLKKDDEIIKIGEYEISSFSDVSEAIYGTTSSKLKFEVKRNGEIKTLDVYPVYYFQNLGFSLDEEMRMTTETDAALGGTNKTKAKSDGLINNGDVLVAVLYNGIETPIGSPDELIAYCKNSMQNGGEVKVRYIRDGETYLSEAYQAYSNSLLESQNTYMCVKQVGISAQISREFFPCVLSGLEYFASGALMIFNTLKLLFTSSEVGLKDMGGFITILNQTANAASSGIENLIYWVALLSINLGIVNLLPIPALDGGRIVLLAYEGITRKKINPKVERWLINGFFFLLMGLIVYILFQDVFRMIIQLKCII